MLLTMTVDNAYFALLFVGLGLLLTQLLVKQKKSVHIFFAILCGSLAMVAAQYLSADTLGPYQYILGLGTCATCNAIWLVSKSMFSGEDSITKRHILVAVVIAGLIIISNLMQMAFALSMLPSKTFMQINHALAELTNLLSSTVLALTCWEAFSGLLKKNKPDFWQRIIFVTSFCTGFLLCTVVAKTFYTENELITVFPWLVVISALQIMIVTQSIMWWQEYLQFEKSLETASTQKWMENDIPEIDESLIAGVNSLLIENKKYLTPNLKMIDLANELDVSEYKISRVIRHHFAAPNFNHFINSLRIDPANPLLEHRESQHWTLLVIALESGFSSLATFNRVFKAQLGYAPNAHRKNTNLAYSDE